MKPASDGKPLASVMWKNGTLIPFENATTHLLAHSLHYGFGAFEGIRCYAGKAGPLIFRLEEHLERLRTSCTTIGLDLGYPTGELARACIETVLHNNFRECYLRPLAFVDYGPVGLFPGQNPKASVAIFAWAWGKYLGDDAQENGIRCKISALARLSPESGFPSAKVTGQYVTSVAAKLDAVRCGFAEAILLDPLGFVAEGSGENIFIIKAGRCFTPPTGYILAGITRHTVITLLQERLKIPVEVKNLTRFDLYSADELFFTGTACEVTPIVEVDHRKIGGGKPGPISRELLSLYLSTVRGEQSEYKNWLTSVSR